MYMAELKLWFAIEANTISDVVLQNRILRLIKLISVCVFSFLLFCQ